MICLIDPFSGLAGDMLLAALLDAGASPAAVRAAVASTGLSGWSLEHGPVLRHGLAATGVTVRAPDQPTSRRAAELIALAARARPAAVAERAVAVLRLLAATEARLHGVDEAEVHLHELGGHDTVVDVVGVLAALHDLGVSELYCGPLPVGSGRVSTSHGVLPVPAPATAALLEGMPVQDWRLPGEAVTPTAAALLKGLGTRFDEPPVMLLGRTGYGAGARLLPDRPNVCAVRLGSRLEVAEPELPAGSAGSAGSDGSEGPVSRSLCELQTNLDDVTGELLGHVIAVILDHGARDCWVTPATTKKGRPSQVLHALVDPEHSAALCELIFAETGTLGVRVGAVRRHSVPRRHEVVLVEGCPIGIKHGPHGSKPEHDDVVAAAARLGLPVREVQLRARLAATGR